MPWTSVCNDSGLANKQQHPQCKKVLPNGVQPSRSPRHSRNPSRWKKKLWPDNNIATRGVSALAATMDPASAALRCGRYMHVGRPPLEKRARSCSMLMQARETAERPSKRAQVPFILFLAIELACLLSLLSMLLLHLVRLILFLSWRSNLGVLALQCGLHSRTIVCRNCSFLALRACSPQFRIGKRGDLCRFKFLTEMMMTCVLEERTFTSCNMQ